MRGNLSTEGGYERARGIRPLPHLTLVRQAPSFPEPHANHQAQNLRRQPSQTGPTNNGLGTLATVTPRTTPKASQSTVVTYTRQKNTVKNRPSRVKKPRAYSAGTPVSPARPRRRASRSNAPNSATETTQNQPVNKSLWLRPHNDMRDAEPVSTHYDSSCKSSLISKNAALRLRLRTFPCPPALQLAVMTDFGMVEPEEFVALDVEAPWLKDSDLGECYVTVVSGNVLESEGIEFLAGKRVLDKLRIKGSLSEETQAQIDSGFGRGPHRPKTMPSMANGSDWAGAGFENSQACGASDYLHPGMATRPHFVPSYITASEEASYHSTNEAALDSTTCTSFLETQAPIFEDDNSSLNQVFCEDDCNSFKSFGAEDQVGNYNLTREARGPRSESVFSQDVSQSTTRMVGPQFTAASPILSQNGFGYCNSYTPTLSPQMWDVQMASSGYSFLSQIPQSLYGSAVATSSANNDRSISEDSPEIQQGMTMWASIPSYESLSMVSASPQIFDTNLPEIRVEAAGSNGAGAQTNPSPPDDTTGDDPNSFL